ncbi:hypothetical protein GOBAR_AA00647 [Gossypium barbadense]|uniref:Uncharacterized protein n=1 Tax=Gossypium barbadense TaxID=3634 RepID=A0A2P5YWL2_GOSBA|nr:hypothetical protein GOBAR_AA00647 [Gossypium barbadense]
MNQQASIQGLETQIDQLSKLISERPQGSLTSNTESNPREHLNAISTQNKEGFIAPEPELQHDNAMNKGDNAVTLQARDSVKTSKTQDNAIKPVDDKTNIQSSLQEPPQIKTIEIVNYYHVENKDVHEKRRLQIKELDEWRTHKLKTRDKPKLRQNELATSPNQLQIGDKVLLDATDPHIVTTTPNKEIFFMVLSIFPFSTVEVSHPKFGTFKHTRPGTRACLKPWPSRGRDTTVRYGRVKAGHDFPKTRDVINPHGRATWPGVNFIGDHGRARGKAQFCFFDTGMRHARAIKPWTTKHRCGRSEQG